MEPDRSWNREEGGVNVSICGAQRGVLTRSDVQQEATFNLNSNPGEIFPSDLMSRYTGTTATISAVLK